MTRVFIWKNNCPQEWEEISFTAFRKARSSGAFSGRFFIETTRMIYDDSDRLIIECSQEQFEKYRHEERHSRYLQEHEGRYLTIPMSDLKDRDQSDEGYEDTDIFVNEEPGTEDMLYITYSLKNCRQHLISLNHPNGNLSLLILAWTNQAQFSWATFLVYHSQLHCIARKKFWKN